MEDIERNQVPIFRKEYENPISGLNLRLRYMIEDFDELVNAEYNNAQITYATAMEGPVKIAS